MSDQQTYDIVCARRGPGRPEARHQGAKAVAASSVVDRERFVSGRVRFIWENPEQDAAGNCTLAMVQLNAASAAVPRSAFHRRRDLSTTDRSGCLSARGSYPFNYR